MSELDARSVGFVETSVVLEIGPAGWASSNAHGLQGKYLIFPFPDRYRELLAKELANGACRGVDSHIG